MGQAKGHYSSCRQWLPIHVCACPCVRVSEVLWDLSCCQSYHVYVACLYDNSFECNLILLTGTSDACSWLLLKQAQAFFTSCLFIFWTMCPGLLAHHACNTPACLVSKRTDSPASPAARVHLHKTVAAADHRELQGNT